MTYFSNVNVGSAPNDGTGDSLRQSFITLNNNFSYINQTIWPDISQNQLIADISSSYISRFNLIETAPGSTGLRILGSSIESSSFGNVGATYHGTSASLTGNVTVGNLIVNGTSTISSYTFESINNTIIGNSVPSEGTFTNLTSLADITMSGNLTGLSYVINSVTNSLSTNVNPSLSLTLGPGSNRKSLTAISVNVNTTITYSSITTGAERTLVLKNYQDGVVRQITLPNDFNNKGATTVLLGANASMLVRFIPFDTTDANVYVNITNN